ncbi:MAG: hypothetical protein ACREX8_00640 [Gammaproteobacteria bacterium]
MLKGAVGAASLGDHVAVRDHLRECDHAAELTGDHDMLRQMIRRDRRRRRGLRELAEFVGVQ